MSSAPAGSIPEPLADPLRALRTGLNWLNGITLLLGVTVSLWLFAQGEAAFGCFSFAPTLFGVLFIHCATGLLPNRPTDVLYLRSFRTDDQTGGIRTSLERALRGLRVSGIRDPKRRWPLFLRFLLYLPFALKYTNPRYLNLEAGDEWKGRLWRSLGEARGVVIDIADLTAAVEAEIRLCTKCMGLSRILFVVRDTNPPDWWRDRILTVLAGGGLAKDIRVLNWPADRRGQPEFEAAVREFGGQLPSNPAGFDPSARRLAEQLPGEVFQESNRSVAVELAVTMVGGGIGFGVFRALAPETFLLAFAPFLAVWSVLFLVTYVSFMRNSGSRYRRWLATALMLVVFLTPIILFGLLLPAVQKVRDASARMMAGNQLKQLGLAIQIHEDRDGQMPAANAPHRSDPKGHPVSWRVLVLPDVQEEVLYQQYRFDEPWDGPNNIKLLDRMPKVFQHPKPGPNLPAGHTYYRVFGSRPNAYPSAAFTDGGRGPLLFSFADGPSNTILIVEAEEAVPWTKPEVLPYTADQPVPNLGGRFTGGFLAAMGDGTTRFFPHSMPESDLRAFITPNGGEVTPPDW